MINNNHTQINAFNDLPTKIDEQTLIKIVTNKIDEIFYFPSTKVFLLKDNDREYYPTFNYHISLNKKLFSSTQNLEQYMLNQFQLIVTQFYQNVFLKNASQQEIEHHIFLAMNNRNYKLPLFTVDQIERYIINQNYPSDFVKAINNQKNILNKLNYTTFFYALRIQSKDLSTKILKTFFNATNVIIDKAHDYIKVYFDNDNDKKRFQKIFKEFKANMITMYNPLFLINTDDSIVLTNNQSYAYYLSYVHSDLNNKSDYENTFFENTDTQNIFPKQFKKTMYNFMRIFLLTFVSFSLIYFIYKYIYPMTILLKVVSIVITTVIVLIYLVILYIYLFNTFLNIALLFLLKDYDNHFKTHTFEHFSRFFLITTHKNRWFKTYNLLPRGISNLEGGLVRINQNTTMLNFMLSMIYYGYQL